MILTSVLFLLARESFPFDQQFNILMRFIVDQTQTPNLKVTWDDDSNSPVSQGCDIIRLMTGCLLTPQVKVAILKYIESLARQMDPTDFVNSSETRLAVSRIITWTTEPKSSDVRKVNLIYCKTNISWQLHNIFHSHLLFLVGVGGFNWYSD